MSDNLVQLTIRHWLPIVTFCPVNNLPDLVYISLELDSFAELYQVRRKVRKLVSFKKMFMEDIALMLAKEFPEATSVTLRLAFDRHLVVVKPNKERAWQK